MKYKYGQTVIISDEKKFFANQVGTVFSYKTDGNGVVYLVEIGKERFWFKERELSTP